MFFSRFWGGSQSVQIDLSQSTSQKNSVETSTDDLDDSSWTDLKPESFSFQNIIEATAWRSELSSLTGERVSLRHRGDAREEEDCIFEVVPDDSVQLESVEKSEEEEEDDDSLESSSLQSTIQNTASLMELIVPPSLSPPDRIVTHTLDPEYIRRGFHLML